MLRLVLAPLIVLLAALGFPALDAYRRKNCYGWLSPHMDEHWHRLYVERSFDAAKNIMSEWVRLDPQRAGKLFSFLLVLSIILGVVL